ncbi:SRPBCC domain-containing protein [Sphingobacterium griseoflavum]|uniref:Activator of Hsp90 ATPase homologue 1/2-like C-terminal domain-containing protein n=1 Tax=Sphingobacterium griseoflavum TaxID=1474952 RepID=A0ABQ3HU57_9SPHI|nr:SRPBCC domain-containing protein [Sphingobacterium griseoflavum]GHE23535.1 hypothetical protein GCM10017764_05030 [Sphingobacterium griseoflavum]
MKKSTYNIDIQAGRAHVFQTMLQRETYRLWTAAFHPASDFEGGWNKGDKIYFLGPSEDGKRQGMIAEIAEHIPDAFISIRHYGMLDGEEEITTGEKIEQWAGAIENYTFEEKNGNTTLTVDVDTADEYIAYFDDTWPRALQKLKELCEN